jgi:microcystin-dependent protein
MPVPERVPMVGEIVLFAGNFPPRGWMLCDGRILLISHYAALFSLLGTTYGGDGRVNFALPNLKAFALPDLKAPVEGLNYIIAIQGAWPERP